MPMFCWRTQANDYNLELGAVYNTKNHIIQTGMQASYDDYVNFVTGRAPIRNTKFLDGSAYTVGLYASDTWQISEKLKSV